MTQIYVRSSSTRTPQKDEPLISPTFQCDLQFISEFSESVIRGPVIWNNIDTIPRSTGIFKEIVAWIYRPVHCFYDACSCDKKIKTVDELSICSYIIHIKSISTSD